MVVRAPERDFVTKYFDRRFNRRVTSVFDDPDIDRTMPAFIVSNADGSRQADEQAFADEARRTGLRPIVLRVPHVIGTGMGGFMMTLARGVARGTTLCIKGNEAQLSIIHAVDLADAAAAVAQTDADSAPLTVSAPPTPVNDLILALGVRIKDKRVGSIAPRWARIIYGKSLYRDMTTSVVVDTAAFDALCPGFTYHAPAEYMRTHIYDDESL